MSLRIEQSSRYEGDGWWNWSVWIEGSEKELNDIKSVTYILHPTFQKPVRTIESRIDKFRLDSAGWGTFLIRAKVLLKDDTTKHLEHELELLYEDGTPTSA